MDFRFQLELFLLSNLFINIPVLGIQMSSLEEHVLWSS